MSAIQDRRAMESVKDLVRSLEAYGTAMATKIGVSANRSAATLLKNKLVARAPFDPNRRPGRKYRHLRQEIRVRRRKARKQHHIVHVVTTGRAFWGAMVERGTVRMAARPWWRPEVQGSGGDVLNAQIAGLRAGHVRAARAAARLAKRKG